MNRRTDRSYVTCAERLGVGYNHLYRVLHLDRSSPALLLTIERRFPLLIARQDASVRQSLLSQCDFHRNAYRWDSSKDRYVPKNKEEVHEMKGIKPMSAYSEAASGFVVSGELQSLLVSLDAEARARIVGQAYLIATCGGDMPNALDNPTEQAVAVMVTNKAVEIRNSFRKRQEQSRCARKSHDSLTTISRPSRDSLERNEESEGSPKPLPNKEVSKDIIITPKPPRKVFVPPTVDEVSAYCLERKNGINASDFVDFYTCKGWMIGKNKMVDWKAAVRTWERNRSNAINRLGDGQGNGIPASGHRFRTVTAGNFRGGTDAQRTEASAVL